MRKSYFIFFLLCFSACAKVVSPSGGPKDETPPVVVQSTPANKSVDIQNNEIQIEFDEYINTFNTNDIIISPYQKDSPELQFVGRSVIIKLNDDLDPNTTYSIDFNGAIRDYRQDNVIETLDYAFSTGTVLDTAQIQGRLIDAETGEAFLSETIRVMAYSVEDSLFYKEPPRYLCKTDSTGAFSLNYLVAGTYNLYALDDLNFNNYFDQVGEALGFIDTPLNTTDSVAKDVTLFVHLTKDSIIRIENSNKLKEGQGDLIFSQKHQQIDLENAESLYVERTEKSDSLKIWYTNDQAKTRAVYANGSVIDSIYLREYEDSLGIHQNFKFSSSQLKTAEAPLKLGFKHPISISQPELIELYQDSVLVSNSDSVFYTIEANQRALEVELEPNDTSRYYVAIYPGAIENFFGYQNTDTLSQRFKKSTFDKRGTLIIDFTPTDEKQYFIELMEKGNVRNTFPLQAGPNKFEKMPKGTYDARLIRDDNENGLWDTGNIYEGLQPERVILLDTPFKVQSGWENEFVLDLNLL